METATSLTEAGSRPADRAAALMRSRTPVSLSATDTGSGLWALGSGLLLKPKAQSLKAYFGSCAKKVFTSAAFAPFGSAFK